MSGTAGEHYRAQRARVMELVRGLDPDQLARQVPACPSWTVHQLLSHLVGVAADTATGRLDGAPGPSWTAAQVTARQDRSVDDLLAEWREHAGAVETGIDQLGQVGWRFVYDITLHEDDLREALGLPLGTGPTQATVLEGLIARARGNISDAGLPALRLQAGQQAWDLGEDHPAAQLTAPDAGELARAMSGRRSDEQIRAMAWQGDPGPYLPHLVFHPPS
jgi:uncharacterized protein (TIGR03083 family)